MKINVFNAWVQVAETQEWQTNMCSELFRMILSSMANLQRVSACIACINFLECQFFL